MPTIVTITIAIEGAVEVRLDASQAQSEPSLAWKIPNTDRQPESRQLDPDALIAAIAKRRVGRPLSRRELETALEVAKGKSNRTISNDLGLQEQSVKNLVSAVMRKLGFTNRVQVANLINSLTIGAE